MNPTTSADALSQLQTQESQAQDPNSILQAQNQQYGVNAAQQTVQGLQGAINNTSKLLQQVAPSVMGRTQNSLVTNAQASKQIENEQAPLNTTLGNDTTQYNQAGTNLQNLEQQAQQAANGIYSGQQDKLSYLQNIYNNLFTQEENQQSEQDKAAALAEQAREANLSASSNAGLASLLSGSSSSGTTSGGSLTGGAAGAAGKTSDQAATAVHSLLGTNDASTIINTYNAIAQSAKNGSTYDQAKLQLLQSFAPGLFKNGQLNTAYIQNTLGKGIKLF